VSNSSRWRSSWRVALIVLAFVVALASVGAFAIVRLRQSDRAQQLIAQATQTPAPTCARQSPSSIATNIRVSNDAYKAHSEPMLAINPANPLNLVGGSKFFTEWDAAYTPMISTYDKGQSPQRGGWLTADYGKGHYTYFAYAFHRQLPYGVPGAYRLLANLLSLGK